MRQKVHSNAYGDATHFCSIYFARQEEKKTHRLYLPCRPATKVNGVNIEYSMKKYW